MECDLLDRNQSYVGFNGNLRNDRGRGYAILGQTARGWLYRAGYDFTRETTWRAKWQLVRQFLHDLKALAEPFHLTVAGLSRDGNEWKSLDEMLGLVRGETGWPWLNACRLRVYAPANYLALWRRWFASRLGFSDIPGGETECVYDDLIAGGGRSEPAPRIDSPAKIRALLNERRMTQKDLAIAIGWKPARLSHILRGRRAWSVELQEAVNRFVDEHGGSASD
jgi:hypothetical protein